MSIQVKKITYTPADIIAMGTVPQIVLPAPPAGYVNNILGISHEMTFNTASYTIVNILLYSTQTTTANYVFIDDVFLTATSDISLPIQKSIGGQAIFSTIKDFIIYTNGIAATGDSDIIAYIIYEEKLINP